MNAGVKDDEIDIQWSPGRIIVTLSGHSFIQAKDDEEDDDAEIEYDEEDIGEDGGLEIDGEADSEFEGEGEGEGEEDGEEDSEEEEEEKGSDVVSVARAINFALGEQGEGSMANNIAVHHAVEVTTPGAPDELYGIMFEAYKGFGVIVETIDPKTKKIQLVEGTLVERNDKQLIVNVKGRLKKLKIELVKSVKLPKAKREKGGR